MCLVKSPISDLSRWNWDGDVIIRESVVPSSRPVVGSRSLKKQYDIDVREFLVTEDNAVMRRTLQEDLPFFLKQVGGDLDLFQSRRRGAFDYRADLIAAFVADRVRYRGRKRKDPWQFPDETLFLKSGDCEDRAFLIAALLLASGISSFNVRAAIGKLRRTRDQKRLQDYDHAWVMYKNEAGHWNVLEPLNPGAERVQPERFKTGTRRTGDEQVEYAPTFLFNQQHLWRVRQPGREESLDAVCCREWNKLDPKFAGQVHQTILNRALQGVCPGWALDALNRNFHRILLFGPVIDEVDNILVHDYNPMDHFDNGYIQESWDLVDQRLRSFAADNRDLQSFAYAAHGIADFYAHSSYLHFARLLNPGDEAGRAEPYDTQDPAGHLETAPAYAAGSSFDLTSDRFSVNRRYWTRSKAEVPGVWNGKIISGRYAQKGDRHGLLELITGIPKRLESQPDFWRRGSLPHHDEIAVDQSAPDKAHRLYSSGRADSTDRMSFANQFRWRTNTACEHIRQAFQRCWSAGA